MYLLTRLIASQLMLSYTANAKFYSTGLEMKVCGLGLGLKSFCKDSDAKDSDLVDSTTSLVVYKSASDSRLRSILDG